MRLPISAFAVAALLPALLTPGPSARAHCEIPCGIYNDTMRVEMILEDCDTIQKSMEQIAGLSAGGDKNYNQLVRWITNKDDHADKIQHVATQYFMTQRVKPPSAGEDPADYHKKVALLHQILVEAMKCKQTADTAHVDNIRKLVDEFNHAYFSGEDLEHLHKNHPH